MNSSDLQLELARNESDKQLANAELEANKKKWIEYIMKNKDEICSNPHPLIAKKKKSALLREFTDKIKKIFGLTLTPRKENIDGIETYLYYLNNIE